MASRTYTVKGMRVLLPTEKTREKNPDLLFTVVGKFFAEDGSALTVPQKAITNDIAADPEFAIDIANETLTVPAGQRGAPKRAGADQSAIDALLAEARK